MKKILFPLVFVLGCLSNSRAQNTGTGSLTVGTYLATDSILPFFLRANQYGIVPKKANFLALRANYHQDYDSTKLNSGLISEWGWGYGASLAANIGKESQFYLQEAYLKGRWRGLELYGGRKKEIFGLVDTLMTSGSYIWSGNALPVPKVQISTPGYLDLTKNGFLGIKFGLSHGWFGTQGPVRNYWLHQKWLYGRIGKPNSKVAFYGGMNHNVQWGGTLANIDPTDPFKGKLSPYPLYTYKYILIPFLQKIVPGDPSKATPYDNGLAAGNQLGSYDILFDINTNFGKIKIYAQQPYDFARSIKNFNNIEDGLYGVSFLTRNENISGFIFEFFYSKSQGSEKFGKPVSNNFGEVDNYFFHGQYQYWWYDKLIIGTPYILATDLSGKIPRYNNRLKYYYLGLNGKVYDVFYRLKFVNSFNYGNFSGNKMFKKQVSINLELNKNINESSFVSLKLSSDFGALYPNVFGLYADYTYKF